MPRKRQTLLGQRFGKLVVRELVAWSDCGKGGAMTPTYWRCDCDCGGKKVASTGNLKLGHTKSCGCLQTVCQMGARNLRWKGGRYETAPGYVVIRAYDYPGDLKARSVHEHVYVMAKHLGRPLRRGENVHHKNGVRNDNRFENLELWSGSQPTGQRVEDKTAWAIAWLQDYAPERLNFTVPKEWK